MSKRTTLLLLLAILLLALPATAQRKDVAGCKDDPLFPTRMANYFIEKCETKAYASYDFFTVKPPKRTVEGELTFIQYAIQPGATQPSALEVVRNYENALEKIGGTIQGINPQWWVNGTVSAGGKEAWVQAEKGNGKIWLRIVRPKAMEQTIVADAAALSSGLESAGHVTVHGIYFDTGKAELKPESAKAIAEIAKLLESDARLNVFVVGHTDGVGSVEANLKLSHDRAAAVIRALTGGNGIAAARLRAFGNGPFAPVASNATEEGRARNRRVELVLP